MSRIPQQVISELLANHHAPCISIYQPMHRASPPAEEDAVRFRDHVDKMEETLSKRYGNAVAREMREKVRSVAKDAAFWEGDRDGIAIFASPDYLRVVELKRDPIAHPAIENLLIVGDSFHVKPLIRMVQSDERYQILCLEMKEVRVFEGDRYEVRELPLKHVPRNPTEAAGMVLSRQSVPATDYIEGQKQKDQGPGSVTEGVAREHFFIAVDKAVWENYSRVSNLPLILCCDPQYETQFRQLSQNQMLLSQGIALNPHRLPPDRLRDEAWKIIGPKQEAQVAKAVDLFRAAKAHHRGSDDVAEVAIATSEGRVGTLLVREDGHVPGVFDPVNGTVWPANDKRPSDDVLDDLAETVLRMDGRVLVLPAQQMPSESGVAAIYRF